MPMIGTCLNCQSIPGIHDGRCKGWKYVLRTADWHPCIVARVVRCAACIAFISIPSLAHANRRDCGALEQRYEQIERAASSVEINSMLFSAAANECETLAVRLLDAGASLEARDRVGNQPLAIAATEGHNGLVSLFLKHKASVDARNLEGSTALFLAAEAERLKAAEILVQNSANTNIAGRSGISPIGAAAYTGNAALVKLLLAHGADAHAMDATGKPAIVYAAGRAYTTVVLQLLDNGIDVNARRLGQNCELRTNAGVNLRGHS